MSPPDWIVLCGTLAAFVAYGNWRGRGNRDLTGYLLADRSLKWPMVALSVMATQASAVTFLSTPGQGYADGLRFVQFYFGLPLAMVVLCVTAIPAFHRARVFTAYEYLERRFDGKTRTLASALFLVQRGLSAGITIYAPALVLSVLLGWDVRWTCALFSARSFGTRLISERAPPSASSAMPVAIAAKVQHQLAEPDVMRDQDGNQRELGMKPAAGNSVTQPEPHPEREGQHRARRHDAEVELALHHLETLDADRVARLRVVDEQARKIEQPREPRDHGNDVQRFDPEHGVLVQRRRRRRVSTSAT